MEPRESGLQSGVSEGTLSTLKRGESKAVSTGSLLSPEETSLLWMVTTLRIRDIWFCC